MMFEEIEEESFCGVCNAELHYCVCDSEEE